MSSTLVNSLAKVYDPNPLHGQKLSARKFSLNGSDRSQASSSSSHHDASLRCMESRIDSLSSQMEHLLNMQQTVLIRLDGLSQDVRGMVRDMASSNEERRGSGIEAICRELHGAVERIESQGCRLEGVEKLVEGTQQVISFIGEVVKSSKLVELLFKQPGNKTSRKAKDDKDKAKHSVKGGKSQKKRKPQDSSDSPSLSESALKEQVEKLNRENTEYSHVNPEADVQSREDAGSGVKRGEELAKLIHKGSPAPASQTKEGRKGNKESKKEEDEGDVFDDTEAEEEEQQTEDDSEEKGRKVENDVKKRLEGESEESSDLEKAISYMSNASQESSEDAGDGATAGKRRVTEEDLVKDDLKKSRVEDHVVENIDGQLVDGSKSEEAKPEAKEGGDSAVKEFVIDAGPPPTAPFDHRIVTPKPHQIATYYTINRDEVLGGGRFGQVYKCHENSSGLTLAAKIIKAKSQKEKEVVRNEIQVMNQLNHANLIQLYAAFESRNDIILVMEYVEGGELFDRIIDENYNLTELDTVLFIHQISEGLQYMHKNYILHLDLKPENILCVSRDTNKIKIIDFGLARRYKPREKLRVNFGTPEFLAPEVINYEFVSFPTDMWSLGVITYMLLSGLSPFLGDDDNETLNNILACQWNFEEEEFEDISDEAKDFITRLLVKSKSWRMSATESLRHAWLSDRNLHYRLHQKKQPGPRFAL
ncbi:myosin light chain kinase 2, skeletal/cardiac muscle isoform X2 [Girardinichthys multiradiatus]|uniref:myosin light chain kinase 2, skeletal/cardiac muscle isoform X2 n=1 Tax=Girardinichthys multiradiatus TaxID=208333 RepID=UPI001FAB4EFA|nr:myosin light chain kinase 2, skeletal/cardiac muscle isoform X2 [Girardinichthys multiradiatus]